MAATLADLRRHPQGNWTIHDVIRICRWAGISCDPPMGGGSHYKVSHPSLARIVTVPFRRPIKPIYIKLVVRFIDEVHSLHGDP
jgi:hypothetical protein